MSAAKALREVRSGSFIYELPGALEPEICREMIRRFEARSEQHYQGRIGQNEKRQSSIKQSTDLRISGREDWKDVDTVLVNSLSGALRLLAELHPYFAANAFKDVGYNLQRTIAGEFYHWHIDGGPGEFSQRQLVAIWYLNTVTGPGGETEFHFQKTKVLPEEGKLILFPPFWTHPHRGTTLMKSAKYIVTTWACFK